MFGTLFKSRYWSWVMAVFFLLVSLYCYNSYSKQEEPDSLLQQFQQEFLKEEKALDHQMDHIAAMVVQQGVSVVFKEKAYEFYTKGIEIAVYANDSLVFWSDNKIPLPQSYSRSLFSKPLLHLANGYYYLKEKQLLDYKIVGLHLIKSDYPYKNKYLKTGFFKTYQMPEKVKILNKKGQGYPIYNVENQYVFSLDNKFFGKIPVKKLNIVILLFILGYIPLLYALGELFHKSRTTLRFCMIRLLAYSGVVIALRLFLMYFSLPWGSDNSLLFSPAYYAVSSFLPSLGDLLLTVLSVFFIFFFFYKQYSHQKFTSFSPYMSFVYIFMGGTVLVNTFVWIQGVFRGMIINSRISLDLNNLTTLEFYSLVGFFITGLLCLGFFMFMTRLIFLLRPLVERRGYFFLPLAVSSLMIFFWPMEWREKVFAFFTMLTLFMAYSFLMRREKSWNHSAILIYFLLIYSASSTLLLQDAISFKEHEQRKILATRLSFTSSPIAEYRFAQIAKDIEGDNHLDSLIYNLERVENDQKYIVDYLRKKYFYGFWDRYKLIFNVCPQDFGLDLQPEDYVVECKEYFDGIINASGSITSSQHLFALNDMGARTNYIGRFEFVDTTGTIPPTMLYIEMYDRFFPEELGYPELLIDDELYNFPEISDYSYARYYKGKLMYKYGSYYYKLKLPDVANPEQMFARDNDEFSHYFDQQSPNNLLVISRKSKSLLDWVAPFSYLFLFYGLLALFTLGINWLLQEDKSVSLSFRSRFQLSILGLILFAFILVGISTIVYISRLNNQKNIEILKEKTHSVQIELEHKMGHIRSLNQMYPADLEYLLKKFSKVFFTDINFYDLNGELLATSLPEVFQKGLVGKQMNPKAYDQLAYEHDLLFIEKEAIGMHQYLSAYITFSNNEGEVIAFLNLPYFARQGEIEREISGFLLTYINIYVLLTVFALLVAILIARFVTQPLLIIRDKLRRVSLGDNNEKIEWKQNDEIGSLVKEYNRMIDELVLSAEKLARSERESAWREMARQVAHEIKNPLTPMKLSVQYLQRAYNDQAEDWDERLKRFSNTLIEQIDSLSSIATAFSDFAKMPVGKAERMDLQASIRSAADLFINLEQVAFTWDFNTEGESSMIYADPNQVIRVFNNLFKNAIQAIPKDRDGLIIVKLRHIGKHCLVEVIDNGKGIPEDQREKIFVPNFTTKTSGMGLGLAMVRNIVQSAKGSIWFESTEGKGTRFFIEFPLDFGDKK